VAEALDLEQETRPTDPVGRVLYRIATVLAVLGGLVLSAMALLTTVSVGGRWLFSEPVRGDFELVAIGTGIGIFAFLPYCQLMRGNVVVDFVMSPAPVRMRTFADTIGGLLYLAIATVLTWRLYLGGWDMYQYNELSMTINFPRWTTFPIAFVLLCFLVVVIAYTVCRSIAETRAGRYFDEAGPHE
jgi:TRAP-type C4-dicarboxylate transport system permease small subunit